jgi:hypothetical protein
MYWILILEVITTIQCILQLWFQERNIYYEGYSNA